MRKQKRLKHKKIKKHYRQKLQKQELGFITSGTTKVSKSFKVLRKERIPLIDMSRMGEEIWHRVNLAICNTILGIEIVDPADIRSQYPYLPQDQPETTEDS